MNNKRVIVTTFLLVAFNPSGIGGATQNWAPIALSDGKLLIRDQSNLMCVKVTK